LANHWAAAAARKRPLQTLMTTMKLTMNTIEKMKMTIKSRLMISVQRMTKRDHRALVMAAMGIVRRPIASGEFAAA
jgi:hypothetical protein